MRGRLRRRATRSAITVAICPSLDTRSCSVAAVGLLAVRPPSGAALIRTDCSKDCQRKAHPLHKGTCKRSVQELEAKRVPGQPVRDDDVIALRDSAATFIARMHDSFTFLAPAIFAGCSSIEASYLHVEANLSRKPGSTPGDDMLDGTITGAAVRSRASWPRPSMPPWCVRMLPGFR